MAEPDELPGPIRALLEAPVGWLPMPPGLPEEDWGPDWAGSIDEWERPEGIFYTLAPWAAGHLGVHLIEAPGRRARLAAAALVPLEPDETPCRWAPTSDEGPAPRQPRERPCLVRPRLIDGIAADYRLERELDRRGVPRAPTSNEDLVATLRIATRDAQGRRPERGGLAVGRRRPA